MQVKLFACLLLVAVLLFVSTQAAPVPDLATISKQPVELVQGGDSGSLADTSLAQAVSSYSDGPKVAAGSGPKTKSLVELIRVLEKKGMAQTALKLIFGPPPKEKSTATSKIKNKHKFT
ncbi:hypothetical protein MBANPS3_002873 [Mucor bainieri]